MIARKAIVHVLVPETTLTGGPAIRDEQEITIESWEYQQAPWNGDVARCIAERSGNYMRFIRWVEE